MYTSPAKSGWHVIDNRRVHTDSRMEADIIRRLAERQGFSGKWSRALTGIAFGSSHYTPDLELSINDNGVSRRAIVELKPTSAMQFTMKDRERACAAAHYYSGAVVLLYVRRGSRWYKIDPDTKHAAPYHLPEPAQSNLQAHKKPAFAIPSINGVARTYRSHGPAKVASVTADMLEFAIKTFLGLTKKPRKKRKK